MIDFKEIEDGETWELFSRDLLSEMGFFIESVPDRGPDGGQDLLAKENLSGKLGRYEFRWLVSCKNFAKSGKSVNENHDEKNILERIESFEADGFLGFYSTVPSSGLNQRLEKLKKSGKLNDFKIFDYKIIENHLLQIGFSYLLIRYFPKSYKSVKPLTNITSKYIPLECEYCGKDLLKSLYKESYNAIIAYVRSLDSDLKKPMHIEDIYWACKGECDSKIESQLKNIRKTTGWEDISDLVIPSFYMHNIFSIMNTFRYQKKTFSDKAYDKLKTFNLAIAQKVMRETTGKEKERVSTLMELSSLRS